MSKRLSRANVLRRAHVEVMEPRYLLAGGVDRLVNDNAGATTTSNYIQSEPSLIAFGSTVVVGFDDSGSYTGTNNHFTGWSRSTDGVSFTDGGTLPNSAGGDAGDAHLARNNVTGRLYFTTIGFNVTTLQLFRSDTNGASWSAPVVATPGGSNEDVHDIVVDNFAGTGQGNVYIVSRRYGTVPGTYFFRSTNHGDSFTPGGGALLTANTSSQGPTVVVGPDHSIYAFWYESSGSILMRKSTDLGLTFGPAVTVTTGLRTTVNGDMGLTGQRNGTATFNPFRTNSFPRPAVNPANGHLSVVVTADPDGAGPDKSDIYLTQSTNGGASWSPRARVNDDTTTTDQWQPSIAITPDGQRLGVFYLSRQEDTAANNQYRLYSRLAGVSGLTFGTSSPVSDVASLPEFGRDTVVNSVYMGDQHSVVATNEAFHIVWADNRSDLPGGAPRKDPNVYYDKIPFEISATWTGAGDGVLWNDPFNWSNNAVPSSITDAIIPAGFSDIFVPAGTWAIDSIVASSPLVVSGTLSISGVNQVMKLSSLTLGASGKFDLGNNDLIIDYTSATPINTIRGYIATARSGGSWNGAGLTSTAAKNNALKNTTLGFMEANDFKIIYGPATTFGGLPIDSTAVLVKYTYYGDADFNGQVNFDDYARIDAGFGASRTGWLNGDFDGNGSVNFDDYSLIDNAFNTQGAAQITLPPAPQKKGRLR